MVLFVSTITIIFGLNVDTVVKVLLTFLYSLIFIDAVITNEI